jgi:Tol biopolymer transport system component
MIGQTISHYRIIEKLGEGGMGVVYKAEDNKLRRSVALKFLPSYLTIDDDTKTRFINEAQTASALDHQNICTIYEIDENDDGQMFISMAYYGNETLKSKMAKGELTRGKSIDIAIQVAQGLGKAHEKGIIHRDIKPANIIVQEDGTVKIIDFGLSKLLSDQTVTKIDTTKGTVAYMSPEQAQGKTVDHRADIWSLGVLLYEMLSSKRPFRGEIDQAVIYSIMNEQPAPLGSLLTGLPVQLENIVARCLEKEPAKRFQGVDEVIAELNQFRGLQSPATVKRASAKTQSRIPWRIRRTVSVGVLLTAIVFTIYFFSSRQEKPVRPIWKIKPLTSTVIYEGAPTWSPDGSMIAYNVIVGNADIYMKTSKGGNRNQLTNNPADDLNPRWSPDGSKIAFVSDRGSGTNVYWIPSSGGAERKIAETGLPYLERFFAVLYSLGDLPWSPDGKQFLFPQMKSTGETAIWRVNIEAGDKTQLTYPPAGSSDLAASWSFDGELIVFQHTDQTGLSSLWLMPAEGGEPTLLLGDQYNNFQPTWSSSNRKIVFVSNRAGHENLWDIDISSGELRQLTSAPERILYPSISHTGQLAYSEFIHQADLYLLQLDSGTDERLTFHSHDNFNAHFSPDGKDLVYQSTRSGDHEIWLHNLTGVDEINLTNNPAIDIKPTWSPDGRQVVFLSNRDGAFYLWIMNTDGSNVHRLTEHPVPLPSNFWSYSLDVRWAPDGKAIGFIAQGSEGRALWIVERDGKNARAILVGAHSFDWWKDSRHVIYNSVSTHELRVADLETGDETILYQGPLTEIFVSSDGRSVAFSQAVGHFSADLYRLSLQLPELPNGLPQPIGEPEKLTHGNGKWHVHNGSWSPDGKSIVYTRDKDEGDIYFIENYE